MQRSLIIAALLALGISACSKQEETISLPAPAVTPALPSANPAPAVDAPKAAETVLPASEQKPAN